MKRNISLRLSEEQIKTIDELRGWNSRSAFVKTALDEHVRNRKHNPIEATA